MRPQTLDISEGSEKIVDTIPAASSPVSEECFTAPRALAHPH